MSYKRLSELAEFDPTIDKLDGYLYVVNSNADDSDRKSLKISIGDLLNYAGVIVTCQFCGQRTFKNKACLYCGGYQKSEE